MMRIPPTQAWVLAVTAFSAAVIAETSHPSSAAYRVIVHPDNQVQSVDRKFLADAFLKKTTRWPDDEVIHPVDLGPSSPVRERFSDDVLSRSVSAVKNYWQQQLFSGRDVPPPELDSDEDVVRYVLKHRGGVGYVSSKAEIGTARTVTVH